jgi:hypothetical protein
MQDAGRRPPAGERTTDNLRDRIGKILDQLPRKMLKLSQT